MDFLSIFNNIIVATASTEKSGIWQAIKNFFMHCLEWLYSFTEIIGLPSWVLAVFIFTLIVKILMQPLMNKQLRSSRKMQKLQPLVKDLQRRYPNNPQKVQMETSRLYKKNNVSPTAGCLPLLLQMPILIALYQALREFVPADTSAFSFLWIENLSMASNEMPGVQGWILPVLAGGATFLQQWVSTTDKKDQTQRIMLIIMPLMFLWFVRQFPALLAIYWVFYSLIGAAIYYIMKLKWDKEDARAAEEERLAHEAVMEEKRRKRKEQNKNSRQKSSDGVSYEVMEDDFSDDQIEKEDEEEDEDPEVAFQKWLDKQGIKIKKKKMRLHPYSTEDELVELGVMKNGAELSLNDLRAKYQQEQQQKALMWQMDNSSVGKIINKARGLKKKKNEEPATVTTEDSAGKNTVVPDNDDASITPETAGCQPADDAASNDTPQKEE